MNTLETRLLSEVNADKEDIQIVIEVTNLSVPINVLTYVAMHVLFNAVKYVHTYGYITMYIHTQMVGGQQLNI